MSSSGIDGQTSPSTDFLDPDAADAAFGEVMAALDRVEDQIDRLWLDLVALTPPGGASVL